MPDFASPLAALFAEFGVAAVYTPPGGGDGVDCTIVQRQPDQVIELGQSRVVDGSTVIEVRASEISAPERGGSFAVDDVTYTILDKPERPDVRRLVWRCNAR